jgi:hypothetical protein
VTFFGLFTLRTEATSTVQPATFGTPRFPSLLAIPLGQLHRHHRDRSFVMKAHAVTDRELVGHSGNPAIRAAYFERRK